MTPGEGDFFPGTSVPYSSGGIIKLGDVGGPDLQLADGVLVIEFLETFDNAPGADDAVWKSGTLFIQVIPAPGAMALLGLAGLFGAPRRRRT